MSTHDYIIDNAVGATVRSDINSVLAAIVSNNSSATAPATMYAYQWWADTANDKLKQRNAANSAWIDILTLSTGASLIANPLNALLAGSGTQVFSVGTPTSAAHAVRLDTPNMPATLCTQAGGALTFAGSAFPLTFRSATLTDGAVSTILADPADLVLPSGATLGFATTVQGRIVVAQMNNGGTSEYAIRNMAGGFQLDETNLISTTAIDTASDSATVWYSTTARNNLPYKIVSVVDAVNTGGAWGNPVLVQPAGGLTDTAVALHAEGSAPMFACRAWVNFNGTGTVAIRSSGNVSSITDNGVGSYTVNFSTAIQDANYSVVGACYYVGVSDGIVGQSNLTTTSVDLNTVNSSGVLGDKDQVSVAIFR